MEKFESAFGSLQLLRWPRRSKEPLRAWDAADEYLLQHLKDSELPVTRIGGRVLIVNDAFGALACALHSFSPVSWSDSSISHRALLQNLADNSLSVDIQCVESTSEPDGLFDLVLIRIPKTNALLEDQLIRLRSHLHKHSMVIGAGMVKHLPRTAFQSVENIVGPLSTSLAKKKSRLLFAQFDAAKVVMENPYPTSYTDPDIGISLSNDANLFSRDRLDPGARFILSCYGEMPNVKNVVDLACGNGVLGIKYRMRYKEASLQFLDESYMAIASARRNYLSVFPEDESAARFASDDGLAATQRESVELILCNPPFHQQFVVGGQIALSMFRDSKRCLKPHGELWVVGNRHLPYAAEIKRLFGNCRLVATNKKFTVLRAVKR